MGRKPSARAHNDREPDGSLAGLACPNPDCSQFNPFDSGNLSGLIFRGTTIDLFDPPQRVAYREAGVALRGQGMTERGRRGS